MPDNLLAAADEDLKAGRVDEAVAKLRQHAQRNPGDVGALERLAFAQHRQGDLPASVATFERLARQCPDSAAAESNLAAVLGQMGRVADALAHFERAIALDATFLDARFNRAQLLESRGQSKAALDEWRNIVRLAPAHKVAWYRLGHLLGVLGRRQEAIAAFERAIEIDPEYPEARWARTMATLPQAYDVGEDPDAFYAEFVERLDALDRWFAGGRDDGGHRAVGNEQPYYLAYHDRNNREVMSRYGDLCSRLMRSWYGDHAPARRATRSDPAKVLIVSGNIHDHAVWTAIVRGWCARVDRKRFRLGIAYTDTLVDRETEIARRSVDTFVQGPRDFAGWVDAIRALAPDILVYPEVGMDRTCIKLAALRLAPVQVAAWGHAETTGMPEIDYFLSAEAFESDEAQQNYSERLVKLAGIGVHYAPLAPERVDLDLAALGIDVRRPIAVAPATPYKFLPKYDWTFAKIAQDVPDCQIVFVTDSIAPRLSEQLARRLAAAFEAMGLDSDRNVRFIPRQPRPQFFSLLRQSTLYLDAIAFSGFNTAMQAFECGLPVLSMQGAFLRNRFGTGLLCRIMLQDLATIDTREYTGVAADLLTSVHAQRASRERIEEGFPTLINRDDAIRSFEDFLESVAPRRTGASSLLARVKSRFGG
jgi:predicted O-linked N-acetylglucosamine transferase (SPINDLY family)